MSTRIGSIVFVLACIISICISSNLEDIDISNFVNKKCYIVDDDCQLKIYEKLLPAVQTGVIDLGVKPIDPVSMANISTSVLGMVDFTMVDATATGVKNCKLVSLLTFIERKYATMHIACNVKMEGTFNVSSSSPVIQKLFGDSINGQGDGTLILNGLNIFFKFHYSARRGEDGENYLKPRPKEITYKYFYSGNTELIADSLISDNQDANDFIVNFLDENSSFIKASIGSAYVSIVVEFYRNFCDKFFNNVPARKFFLDDLTPFIKN